MAHQDELSLVKGNEKSCDGNNNAGVKSQSNTSAMLGQESSPTHTSNASRQLRQQSAIVASGEELLDSRFNRTSESNASESTDDWHLLDVDSQSISSSSSVVSSREKFAQKEATSRRCRSKAAMASGKLNRDDSNNNNEQTTTTANYFDRQPVNREHLSPALIYICTAIYSLLPLASLLTFAVLISLLFTRFWYVTLLYYSLLIFDAKTCNRGGRRWLIIHKARFWSYLAAYFPIKLRHSANFKLDPNENYILNYHPHGISAFGCVASFATDGLEFSRWFPNIRPRFMVHETSFLVPVMRETFMLRGDCSVNSKSFDYILEKRWQMADGAGGVANEQLAGNLLALCGGGLAEADLSDADTLKVVCANRKGFIKKALIHGAHLIPCIAFGENSVFKKVNLKPGSLLHRLEKRWYELFKFKHPIYYGRSLLFGSSAKGAMPFKRPITVVMGDPIQVRRAANPNQDEIENLHDEYLRCLKAMYDDNKASLCQRFDKEMEIV